MRELQLEHLMKPPCYPQQLHAAISQKNRFQVNMETKCIPTNRNWIMLPLMKKEYKIPKMLYFSSNY